MVKVMWFFFMRKYVLKTYGLVVEMFLVIFSRLPTVVFFRMYFFNQKKMYFFTYMDTIKVFLSNLVLS